MYVKPFQQIIRTCEQAKGCRWVTCRLGSDVRRLASRAQPLHEREETRIAIASARLKRAGLGKRTKGRKSEAMRCKLQEHESGQSYGKYSDGGNGGERGGNRRQPAAALQLQLFEAAGHFSDWKEVSFDWLRSM